MKDESPVNEDAQDGDATGSGLPLATAYLSVADRQIESYVSQDDFERELVAALLFQRQVVIPDIFLFISNRLRSHVYSGNQVSLIETALANGIALPYFRVPGHSSVVEALDEIEREGIQGVLPGARELANRLQGAVEHKPEFRFGDWGNQDLGVRYENTVKLLLQRPSPPGLSQTAGPGQHEIVGLWQGTHDWRTALIDEAIRDTPNQGLRRGAIMTALSRRISGGSYRAGPVQDMQSIIGQVGDNPHLRHRVQAFLQWVNECYHINQAGAWDLSSALAPARPEWSVAAKGSLGKQGDSVTDCVSLEWHGRLPSPAALLALDPALLLGIRRKRVGGEYFDALETWLREPTEEAAGVLRDRLTGYSEEILAVTRATGSGLVRFIVTVGAAIVGTDPLIDLALLAMRAAETAAGVPLGEVVSSGPINVGLSTTGALGGAYFAYRWYVNAAVDHRVTVARRRIESTQTSTGVSRASITLRPRLPTK